MPAINTVGKVVTFFMVRERSYQFRSVAGLSGSCDNSSDAKARRAAAITQPYAGSRDVDAVRGGANPLHYGAGSKEPTKQLC
jgi:hypothetical protein